MNKEYTKVQGLLYKFVTGILLAIYLSIYPSVILCGIHCEINNTANCFLVAGTQEGISIPGQMVLDLSYRFIPMDRAQSGSDKVSEAITPAVNFENGFI